ncbi:aldehyde dehydrogenase family protein [Sinorhizobium meliloti]|uniref:aldehyde dehydrogenase family protein n=1 Tax=Rhizobium meliloti TaxID=382 RepID=UPI000FD6F6FE|nr:aldehyde dehydrogenase family protein [Sinorhizobium meliloti]RVP97786.1 aldehyde dehydrogenase family protein [Sinorhizobium meliloti]
MQDKIYVDGGWRAASDGGTLPVIDPATEEVFHRIAAATESDASEAVHAAYRAFHGGWSTTAGAKRAEYLRRFSQAIKSRLNELAQLEVRDNGKPFPEAAWDISDAAHCFDLYARYAEDLDARQGHEVELPDRHFKSRVYYEPAGVAALITPWNYPLLMAVWKVAAALAAGCTVVLKPSQVASLTCLELGIIASEVGLPDGVINILPGRGSVLGPTLTKHPLVAKVAFTGSGSVGSEVGVNAIGEIKQTTLELGGKSPMIIFEDADIDEAVEWTLFGVFWNKGEVCSATSRLLVAKPIANTFLSRLKSATERIRIGSGFEEGVKLGPLISAAQYQAVMKYIEIGRSEANLLTGGQRAPGFEKGYFVAPTIFTDVPTDARIWREEIFGPVLAVRTFDDEAEALSIANDSEFGLAGAVITKDPARAERVARALEAGVVWVNCSQPTFAEVPWGGVKQSGIGRELGVWGINSFLEVKQVTERRSAEPWGWFTGK